MCSVVLYECTVRFLTLNEEHTLQKQSAQEFGLKRDEEGREQFSILHDEGLRHVHSILLLV
jgi:hypothetical protein